LKILYCDKIYLNDKIKKNAKKEYSKIMRFLIKKSIEEKQTECYGFFEKI